jgi:hypothetical protein
MSVKGDKIKEPLKFKECKHRNYSNCELTKEFCIGYECRDYEPEECDNV